MRMNGEEFCCWECYEAEQERRMKLMNHSVQTAITQMTAVKAKSPSIKERIREHLIAKGPATPEQIAEATGLHYRSVQPRISELLRDGLIYTTGVMTETTLRRKSAEVAAYIG